MSRIYLIRHGKTEANERHLYCGSTDLSLSAAGRAELEGKYLPISGAHYITSGMKRTEETLELLFGAVPFRTEPGLREIDFGDFEMHSYEELKEDPAYQAWITGDNEKNVPPNGESGEQMCGRVLEAFARLEAESRDTVAVTHGGVIAAIMAAKYPAEGKNRYQWQPAPGCGYLVDGDHWEPIG